MKPLNKAAKAALVATALNNAFEAAYQSGTSFAGCVTLLRDAHRFGSADDYSTVAASIRVGRVVAYIEQPPQSLEPKLRKCLIDYRERHWGNLPLSERRDAAAAFIALPTPDSAKPEKRTEWQHKAVRAADSAVSTMRSQAGITAKKAGGNTGKPKAGSNEPEKGPSVASPSFSNENDAEAYIRNTLAALVTTCTVNKQTGSAKSVKGVMHKVESILIDAKRAVEKALAAE